MNEFEAPNARRMELESLVYDHMYAACRTTTSWMPTLDASVLNGTDRGPYVYGNPEWIYKKPLWHFDAADPIFWDDDEQINQLIFHFLSFMYPKVDIFGFYYDRLLRPKSFVDVITPLFWRVLFKSSGKSSRVYRRGVRSLSISPVTRICWRAIAGAFVSWRQYQYREFIKNSRTDRKTHEFLSEELQEPEIIESEITGLEAELIELEAKMDEQESELIELEAGFTELSDHMYIMEHDEGGWEKYCDEQVDLSREWLRWRRFPHTNEEVIMLWEHIMLPGEQYRYVSRLQYRALFTHSGDMDIVH